MAQLSDHRYSDSDGRPIFLLGLVPGTLIGFWAGAVAAIVID